MLSTVCVLQSEGMDKVLAQYYACTFEHYILHFLYCRKMTKVNVLVLVDITFRTFYHLIFRVH